MISGCSASGDRGVQTSVKGWLASALTLFNLVKYACDVPQAAQSSAPRDLFLNSRDIQNIAVKIHEPAWKFDKEQAQSIRLFTEKYTNNVLLYKEQALLPGSSFITGILSIMKR